MFTNSSTAGESSLFFGNAFNSIVLKYVTGNSNAEIKSEIIPFPIT